MLLRQDQTPGGRLVVHQKVRKENINFSLFRNDEKIHLIKNDFPLALPFARPLSRPHVCPLFCPLAHPFACLLNFPLAQMVGLLYNYFPVTPVGMPANYFTSNHALCPRSQNVGMNARILIPQRL